MPGTTEIRWHGLPELDRALVQLRREVVVGLRPALMEAAEPVRAEAQTRALSDISNIGQRWSLMRVGVTAKTIYVAPKSRRRGGSPRPNLGGLLFKEMSAALDANGEQVRAKIDALVTEAAASAGWL